MSRRPILHLPQRRKSAARWLGDALIGTAIALVVTISFAFAADKGGPRAQSDVPYMPPAATGWSGCGAGVHAGLVNADADFGSIVNMGANGQAAGVDIYCDRAFDRFVVGLFVDYSWAFGDIHTLGVDTDLTVGGRAGFLLTQNILAYALAAWTRADAGSNHYDGIKVGGGLETKIPGAPFFLALEYTKATYANVGGSTVDVNADEVMLRFRYKFNMGAR